MRVSTTFAVDGPEAPEVPLDEPSWLLHNAAEAAGVTVTVLKAWLSREPVVISLGHHDQGARGKGSARVFTLRRVLAVAIAAELVRLGVAPSRAGKLAVTFMDKFIDDEGPPSRKGGRRAHATRQEGTSPDNANRAHWRSRDAVLVAYPEADALWVTQTSGNLDLIKRTAGPGNGAAIVLFYDKIIDRVRGRLTEGGKKGVSNPEIANPKRVLRRTSK